MTENEAIDKLNNLHYKIVHTSFCNKVYESEIEALCMAKDCLKEIQEYRAIGKVEEVKYLVDYYNGMMHDFGDDMRALEQYRAIGTIEEFKALKEKAESKKPIRKSDINGKYEEVTCPNCGRFVDDYTNKKYCNCGQALDWQ